MRKVLTCRKGSQKPGARPANLKRHMSNWNASIEYSLEFIYTCAFLCGPQFPRTWWDRKTHRRPRAANRLSFPLFWSFWRLLELRLFRSYRAQIKTVMICCAPRARALVTTLFSSTFVKKTLCGIQFPAPFVCNITAFAIHRVQCSKRVFFFLVFHFGVSW